MYEAVLEVSGMTCGACSASVTEALENLPSVSLASVSLLTNQAKVTCEEAISPDSLVLAVEDCGFDAKVVSTTLAPICTTIVNIQGMTCAACSGSITDALMLVKGVRDASVSLLTASGRITHDPEVSPADIVAAIEDCGFDAAIESSTGGNKPEAAGTLRTAFHVTGMTCGACSASITEALNKLQGVRSVSVSQLTELAVVEHDARITPETLKAAIEDCGFDAALTESTLQTSVHHDTVQDLVLQVYGIDENCELSTFQYNVEALFASLPGVLDSQFIFRGQVDAEELANSAADQDPENLIDELRVSVNTAQTGIRSLVDALNSIDERYLFVILNSVDQSLNTQLKLLSKIKDIQYWRTNFLYSLACGIPVIALALTEDTSLWRHLIIVHGLYWVSVIEFALATHILFNLGAVFFKKFGTFVRHRGRNANMDVLVCISTLISYTFSVYSMILSVWTGQTNGPPKVLFETVAMLVCFVSFGKWIENKAKGATSTALSRLLSLTPTTCQIVTDTDKFEKEAMAPENDKATTILELPMRTIAIDLLQTDDIAFVLPGGKVPADGIVQYGTTEIDESVITGEAIPVAKSKGDTVIGGSINGPHMIYIKVTGAGKNSQLHQIIDIVKDSQVKKAPVQRFADYIAARFVMAVLVLSTTTFIVWMIISLRVLGDKLPKAFAMEENGKYFVCLKLAISVVVVACPCALGLAAPTAVMVGTGVGAQNGALIKGGDILEKASGVNVILFDKTGTLTSGEMSVNGFKNVNEKILPEVWWNLVGSVEVNSEHPTGRAITKYAKEQLGLTFEDDTFTTLISGFEVLMGLGVRATIQYNQVSYEVAVGNTKMVVKYFPEAREALALELEKGLGLSTMTMANVVVDGKYCGYMLLSDTIKPNARQVVDYLQHVEKYQVGIVTGDSKAVAETVGARLGIAKGNIFSEVSPIEKDKVVLDLRKRFGGAENISIAFVGDGINDAPALVQADIGMAISTGTDIAIDSAEIVLMGSEKNSTDLIGVITALQVSAATFRKIKWNFVCATVYNFVMMPFAMGCFLPFNVMLPPPAAAAAMACSLVSVVVNSLMLKKWKLPNVGAAVQKLKLNEESIGEGFTLKHGTLTQFNQVKRGKFHLRKVGGGWVFRRKVTTEGSPTYEMLPST